MPQNKKNKTLNPNPKPKEAIGKVKKKKLTPRQAHQRAKFKLWELNQILGALELQIKKGNRKAVRVLLNRFLKKKNELISLLNQILHPDFSLWYDGLGLLDFAIWDALKILNIGLLKDALLERIRAVKEEKKKLERLFQKYPIPN